MRIDVTGRHVEVTPPLRQLIEKRLAKIERLLNDAAVSATVVLTKEKYRHRVEIVVHARGDRMMRGLGEGNAWPISLRQAVQKVEQQAQRVKTKWTENKRNASGRRTPRTPVAATSVGDDGAAPLPRIVRGRYPVKPMAVEDAALRVEESREAFVVFRNAETDAVSIMYRRKDGNLGLIEPD
jgi:putative sigma-54 modulation protein